ncbi:MAG: hypothetical protein KKA67_13760 [Spirochaetes bacterium]|nr:hypothetical protein [Spirochaetota bacterium]MBU1079878.1 hypothetical protein [Spirochaetota bacterium]
MKRIFGTVALACLIGNGAFSQELASTPLPSRDVNAANPQFAVSILTDYFVKDEKGDRVGGIVVTSIGGALLAGGLAGVGYSFAAPAENFSSPESQMLMRGLTIGAAGGGLLLGGIGLGLLAKPEGEYKREYAYLYAETDPVVKEAIAYGIMKELADEARRSRIVGGVINIATPLAAAGGRAIASAITGDWDDFGDKVVSTMSWTLPSLVSGIITLVSGKSSEERMLDSYRAMSASYSASVGARK